MRTETNPRGETVYFIEDRHKYFVGNVVLTPVTTFVESFFQKFESEKVAKKFAKKHNRKVNDLLGEWRDARIKGEELGTAVHAYAYGEVTGDHCPIDEKYELHCKGVDKALAQIKRKFKILGAEEIIFSVVLGLAGTIDLICEDPKSESILLFDWKTNKELTSDNVWQTGLPPLQNLEDCDLVRYSLQINSYEYILREENYFPGRSFRRALIHVREDQIAWYKIKDMQNEVRKMIKWI